MSVLRSVPRSAARSLRSGVRGYASVVDAAGVKVAAIETGVKPATTSITVVAKAGSRYESSPGVAAVLKNFAFKSTASGSALKTVRETELYGGVLSAALSREHLYLTAEFLRGDEAHFLPLLASVLSSTHYHAHEYSELVLPTVEAESLAASVEPTTVALDLAHQVAFRRGLGNSLFANAAHPVSLADVKSFANAAFAKSNLAVLGTGISSDALAKAVESAFGANSPSAGAATLSAGSSTYYGGEARVSLDSHANPLAQPTLVIAYGVASSASADLIALPHILGGVPAVKWSVGSTPLAQAASKVPGASARAVLLPYTDASLLAVVVSAPTNEGVRTVATEVAAAIKAAGSGSIDAATVKRAVAKAKLEQATNVETYESILANSAASLFAGSIPAPDASFASLDAVSASSLGKVAGELFKAKPTVVAVGNVQVLPYADEIGL